MKKIDLFFVSFLILSFFAGGCKSVDSVIEESRPWAEKKLAGVEAIRKAAGTIHLVTKNDGRKLSPPPVFTTEKFSHRLEGWNAGIVFYEELKDYSDRSPNEMNITYSHLWFRGSSSLIHKGLWLSGYKLKSVEMAEECFKELKNLEYLLVLRVKIIIPKGFTEEKFASGRTIGDALLFHVDTEKLVGAFPIDVKTSKDVYVRSDKIQYDLQSNLGSNFGTAIDEALVALFPGAKPLEKPFPLKK